MPRRDSLQHLKRTMRRTFGIGALRPGQDEVMRSVLRGQDTLAIMPTGAGKSLCYQLPALHLNGTTLIVSPLISLMKDQVDKLAELGVEAVQLNSTLGTSEERTTLARIDAGEEEFVFTTPERATDPDFLAMLGRNVIDFIVIDEAHCISEWGHDFRPAYLELPRTIAALGRPPVLALTATATDAVIEDIIARLGLDDARIVNTGTHRDNLHFAVVRVTGDEEKLEELGRLVEATAGIVIVYCATVRHVEAVADHLWGLGLDVVRYHGRRKAAERREAQDRLMRDEARIVVATNAFGMGIDKPDIRCVIHYDMPGSLEAYYQEAGRAGRDGEPARCVLLFAEDDRRVHRFFLGGRHPRLDEIRAVVKALRAADAAGPGAPLAVLQESASAVARSRVRVVLAMLKDAGIVTEHRGPAFRLRRAALDEAAVEALARQSAERAEADRARLDRMIAYGRSVACRWRLLTEYFEGRATVERCGHCDNCMDPPGERLVRHMEALAEETGTM